MARYEIQIKKKVILVRKINHLSVSVSGGYLPRHFTAW